MKGRIKFFLTATLLVASSSGFFVGALADQAPTTEAKPAAPAPAGNGVKEVEKPLEVNGQARNLSMMMVLKEGKDEINFVNVRKNFKDKVPNTVY